MTRRRAQRPERFLLAIALLACAPRAAPEASTRPVAAAIFARADSLRIHAITPGVTFVRAHDPQGPWALHVLEIDTRICTPVLRARKARPTIAGRAPTSALAANDLGGVNADFFQLPGGTPVGAHVSEGRVLVGPGTRAIFATGDDGWWIDYAELAAFAAADSDTARIIQVNRPTDSVIADDGLLAYDVWYGDSIAAPAARLRAIDEDRAVVLEVHPDTGVILLGNATHALHARGTATDWLARRAPGDAVTLRVHVVARTNRARALEAVGGFPKLVEDGRSVVARATVSESFAGRHPRTAVGWSADGARFFLVVVDGRQPPWSAGMSLDELADLMLRLGTHEALNLDGGGSTAMVVRGHVVNRPSDANGERAVGNALALEACR